MFDESADTFDDETASWSPLSTAEWVGLMDHVPMLGRFQKSAMDAGVSPTGALYTAVSTVGLALPFRNIDGLFDADLFDPAGTKTQKLSTIESFFAKEPLPVTSYLAMLGDPGTGKTQAATYASPSRNVELLNAPTSGQALAAGIKRASRLVKNPDDESSTGLEMRSPNYLIHYDEATVFDAYLEGKWGGTLKGALSGVFYGEPKKIAQAAATDDANRTYPKHQRVNVAVVVNAQPGTCAELLADHTGLGSRFLWCAVAGSEYVSLGVTPTGGARNWFQHSGWCPPYDQPFLLELDENARVEIDLVAKLSKVATEPDNDIHTHLVAELDAIEEGLAEWWLSYGGGHNVAKTVRVAAGLAAIEANKTAAIEPRHLAAARILISKSETVKTAYAAWLKQQTLEKEIEAATNRRAAGNAAETTLGAQQAEATERVISRVISKLDELGNQPHDKRDITNKFFSGRQRTRWATLNVTIGDCLEEAVTKRRLCQNPDGTFELPTEGWGDVS